MLVHEYNAADLRLMDMVASDVDYNAKQEEHKKLLAAQKSLRDKYLEDKAKECGVEQSDY